MTSSSTGNLMELEDKSSKRIPSSELAKLPPNQYAIMKKIVAQTPQEMSYSEICDQIKQEGFTQSEVDMGLHQLVQTGYLNSFFEKAVIMYMATVDGKGRPSSRDHEQLWDNFQFGLDSLDIDLDL